MVVEPDMRVGTGASWFGAVMDVAGLGAGRFAVLDWMERDVTVFDSAGREVARYGGEGDGPGEYRQPWALAAVGGGLVVRQNRATSTFTVLGPEGEVRATASASLEGDWSRPRFRDPTLDLYGFQLGPEDVTRRLAALGDSGFIHMLQPDEFRADERRSHPAPPVWLIRYGPDATPRDTLATLVGAPTLLYDRQMLIPGTGDEQVIPGWKQPLFSARPVWTTGDGWLALGHGDSSHVVVRRPVGDTLLVVRWPDRRPPVTEQDRIEAARWATRQRILDSSYARETVDTSSSAQRREGIRYDLEHFHHFAERTPTLRAAYGSGACLFLSGYAPEDWGDGTALTWVVLDVEAGTLDGVVRLRPPEATPLGIPEFERRGAAVRAFDARFAYATYRDGDGVPYVARYRLPELGCTAR